MYPPSPWPAVYNGIKVTFTPVAGGAGTGAYLQYIGAGQINAVLPSTLPVGNYVSIEVRDDGSGIKPEHLGKIFAPFFTT